jgi:hypothetical protein
MFKNENCSIFGNSSILKNPFKFEKRKKTKTENGNPRKTSPKIKKPIKTSKNRIEIFYKVPETGKNQKHATLIGSAH